ncbi:macrolide family glycosyltransferase [Parablautia intestinalis]|uniref:macrolide family glycosyltransferase n=1 Tax=Parablautia intestinalis TaxID=2320100 RepID=UPI00259D2A11|nr:macrolide family glycosyltransferase [Parablautia intestinalis]
MSKIVFFCIPAHGHTNPTLGVVRQLTNLGHQVWYYSYNFLKEEIEAAGANFVSCDAYDTRQELSPEESARLGRDLPFSIRILADTTLALGDVVCRHMAQLKPDCIVADSMAVWGKAIALKLGIPFVCSTTTFAFNRYSAQIMKQSPKDMLAMILSMPKVNHQIKRLQNNGYPFKNILDIIQSDENTHTIVYASPQFQPCSDTFPDKYAFVGPVIRPSKEQIIKKKKVLIYMSMGTVNNDMLPLYLKCISAFRATDYQLILSVGNIVDRNQFRILPDNISVFPQVDQIAILKKTDIFISHCGMNSVSESLYFGVPLIMLPQTSEQCGVARQVQRLGAGITLKRPSVHGLLSAVQTLLRDPSYQNHAKELSEGFKKCAGVRGAAEKILQVCDRTE